MPRGRPSHAEPIWYQDVAELMVRKGLRFIAAARELEIDLDPKDAESMAASKAFQRCLWTSRNQYYREIAFDPQNSKDAALGRMLLCAENLMLEGLWDKAADVLTKMAKVAGWTEADKQTFVFGNLTQADIDALKAEQSGNGQAKGNHRTRALLSN